MTTYKEYAEQHPTIQIDERLYAKAIPADLVTILESHNGISDSRYETTLISEMGYKRL